MTVGLVYTEVDCIGDVKADLTMIKTCLVQEIPSVGPVQIDLNGHVETAITNQAGGSFLTAITSEIKLLRAETQELRAETKELREESRSQKEEIRDLQGQVTVLRPLGSTAIGIRKRWFGVFCRHRRRGGKTNQAVINYGNKLAHSGDIITDLYLLENNHMHYFHAFKILYGVNWHLAKTLVRFPHMVAVMNCRATSLAEGGSWPPAMERDFQDLALWTKNVSPQELALFNADTDGNHHYKRLYLRLPHDE